MRIAIMQPYLFPYIGYFQLLNAADKFVVFDDVNYINKGWINRNRFLVNHQPYLFTVPLQGASQNKLINEIDVEAGDKWRNKLIKTIEQSYLKAPHFSTAMPVIKEVLLHPESNLAAFVTNSLLQLSAYMGISTQIVPTSGIYNNKQLAGEDRILDICIQEKATEYVNPIGGTELYSREKFEEKGIKLFFLKTHAIDYPQFGKAFVPWLSVLDIMMFCSVDEIKGLLGKMELI